MASERALVIDDDDIARELLASILRDGGYETFELRSPIGASQTLLQERIGIVVLDLMMPEMRGDKLVKLLRANRRLADIAIVLVSSCPAEELGTLAAQVGAEGLVEKRYVRAQLLEAVARAKRRPKPVVKLPTP
jgi:CheY-like chemotaxis protein